MGQRKNSLSTSLKAKVLAEQDEEMEYLKNEKSYERHIDGKVTYTRTTSVVLTPNRAKMKEGDTIVWTASSSKGTEKQNFYLIEILGKYFNHQI